MSTTSRSVKSRTSKCWSGHGVRRIVISCPHCFNTFANEYPDLGGQFEVIHDTEATRVATACPFCLTMFDEGIASRGAQDQVAVDDIAVYVARSMRRAASGDASAPPPRTSG
jgi:Fe-S oxidoreductase